MNNELIGLLRSNLGMPLSAELAADIMLAADRIPALIACDAIDRIKPERYGDFVFSLASLNEIDLAEKGRRAPRPRFSCSLYGVSCFERRQI